MNACGRGVHCQASPSRRIPRAALDEASDRVEIAVLRQPCWRCDTGVPVDPHAVGVACNAHHSSLRVRHGDLRGQPLGRRRARVATIWEPE